jgi:hypothetical protein
MEEFEKLLEKTELTDVDLSTPILRSDRPRAASIDARA